MFTHSKKFSFVLIIAIFTLSISLIFPFNVLADDGIPPTEAASDTTPADPPAQTDPPVVEVASEANPPQAEDIPAVSAAETVQAMSNTDVMLVDENSQPIPLATEQAAELLTNSDPYIIRSGVTYRFLPVGGCVASPANCTESTTPIQAAINFSVGGETIFIDPGTYIEQLEINKNITLQSTAPGVILQSPTSRPLYFSTTTSEHHPIIYVHNTAAASIIGLMIDGQGMGDAVNRFDGIGYYNAGGTVEGNTIAHIRNNPLSGAQNGVGLYVYNQDGTSRTLNVFDNTIYDYQKNGMALSGNGLTVNVQDNTVTGAGSTALIAQNGIQVSYGAQGSITGNTVSENFWTGTYGGSNDPVTDVNADGAAGILIYQPGTSTIDVANNVVKDNQFGIVSFETTDLSIHDNVIAGRPHTGSGYPVGILIVDSKTTIKNNEITLNDYGILVSDTPGGMPTNVTSHNNSIALNRINGVYSNVFTDATQNWWGAASGPLDATSNSCGVGLDNPGGAGNAVNACVLYDPWLTKNPFGTTIAGGGGAAEPRPNSPFLIPQTGSDLITISCTNNSVVLNSGEMQITFVGLCGYDVSLNPLTEEMLPSNLKEGQSFLFALNVNLFKDNTLVKDLPANAKITITFPVLGVAKEWDSKSNAWADSPSAAVDNHLKVHAHTGTFILLAK